MGLKLELGIKSSSLFFQPISYFLSVLNLYYLLWATSDSQHYRKKCWSSKPTSLSTTLTVFYHLSEHCFSHLQWGQSYLPGKVFDRIKYNCQDNVSGNNRRLYTCVLFVYINIYIYKCLYICIYEYIYVYVCVCVCVCVYTYNKSTGCHPSARKSWIWCMETMKSGV